MSKGHLPNTLKYDELTSFYQSFKCRAREMKEEVRDTHMMTKLVPACCLITDSIVGVKVPIVMFFGGESEIGLSSNRNRAVTLKTTTKTLEKIVITTLETEHSKVTKKIARLQDGYRKMVRGVGMPDFSDDPDLQAIANHFRVPAWFTVDGDVYTGDGKATLATPKEMNIVNEMLTVLKANLPGSQIPAMVTKVVCERFMNRNAMYYNDESTPKSTPREDDAADAWQTFFGDTDSEADEPGICGGDGSGSGYANGKSSSSNEARPLAKEKAKAKPKPKSTTKVSCLVHSAAQTRDSWN